MMPNVIEPFTLGKKAEHTWRRTTKITARREWFPKCERVDWEQPRLPRSRQRCEAPTPETPSTFVAHENPRAPWEGLPRSLRHAAEAIEKSRDLLKLTEDWDGEGAIPIQETTWTRAAEFLARQAR